MFMVNKRRFFAVERWKPDAMRRQASRVVDRSRLLMAVVVTVVVAVGVGIVAYLLLHQLLPVGNDPIQPKDLTQFALTIAAGIGGVVALVVAYRRQQGIEQGLFVERFGAAASQLGHSDVAVRLAGVYAMAGVADEASILERQQCVDVLCGYLRLPYSPSLGASHQSELQRKIPGREGGETTSRFQYRQNDKEVRQTIVRVITVHLQPGAAKSWSKCSFDFQGAALEDAAFIKVTFSGPWTSFKEVTFNGETSFDEATFSRESTFEGATFSGETSFDEATFSRESTFRGTTYNGETYFREATFSRESSFSGATFSGERTWFDRATFNGEQTWFDRATFNGEQTSFFDATFNGEQTSFSNATFNGEQTSFSKATFNADQTSFSNATFNGRRLTFFDARFNGTESSFFDARFNGTETGFFETRFSGKRTLFGRATFSADQTSFDVRCVKDVRQRVGFLEVRRRPEAGCRWT